MIDVTDDTFQTEVLEKSVTTPVVVDLWAEWCGPCKTLTPILEKVIAATNGQVVGVKVNVEENPQLNEAFRVQSIPAVFALSNGAIVDTFTGAQPEEVVTEFINNLIGATPGVPDDLAGPISEPGQDQPSPDQPGQAEAEIEDQGPTPEQDAAEERLAELLPLVKSKDEARVEFLELLELLGPNHENTGDWRRKLSTQLL
jgi:putative thioredoxin